MGLSRIPVAERPREKMLASGVATLSDAELLAVLLGTGGCGRSVIDSRVPLQPFGCQLERPSNHQYRDQSNCKDDDNDAYGCRGQSEDREERFDDLDQQPCRRKVGHAYADNVATL